MKKVSTKRGLVDAQVECKKAMAVAERKSLIFRFMAGRYILMDLFREENRSCCPTLRKFLSHGAVSLQTAIKIATDMCIVVHELHVKGLLHSDLHSGNILVRYSSHVEIVDF